MNFIFKAIAIFTVVWCVERTLPNLLFDQALNSHRQIFAMVGTSKRHNLIAGSLYATIRAHLKPPCKVYFANIKVRIENVFYYPDLLVSCMNNHESRYYETESCLIIEVLSPSTEAKDRFEKRLTYQRLPSLQEYMLVSQDKMAISIYRKEQDYWLIATYEDNDTVDLTSINLSMQDLYADVIDL